ncbi:MAG: helicase-exonuclease AddAB subunit AddA [Firmicutes bacterium]|nr:helicase-exonuclease AddAB subunit AddA [Bacillota bacterium]
MAVNWTDEQREAIDAPMGEGAILVSAAAGSGKTAVLVERVLSKILDGGTSMDKILAVTFTNAAASEMREKIIKRMHNELKVSKGEKAEYIKQQIRLALSADILTIDSFCMRVLQNNYYVLGIDPNFAIADSAESALIKEDALDALFSRLYRADGEDSARFNHLLNIYASNRNDNGLKDLVKEVYNFIQSFAEPEKWLYEKAAMYKENMLESVWMSEYAVKFFVNAVGEKYYTKFAAVYSRAEGIGEIPETLTAEDEAETVAAYGEMGMGLIRLIRAAERLRDAKDWKAANDMYNECIADADYIDSMTLRNKPKDITVTLDEWKTICKSRNNIKKSFFEECSIFAMSAEEMAESMRGGELKALAEEIVWIVGEFDSEYKKRKDIRNVKEFSDIEHLAYKLFYENEDVCAEYAEKYDEILIDEYQDTNELQDSIFAAVSRGGKNLFMVGDLKQSIYRFRGGDPTIFKTKSGSFQAADNENRRIILSQNFRSRQEVLKAVNEVFERTMSNEIGDVNYSGKERITRDADKDVWDDRYKAEAHYIAVRADGDAGTLAAEAEFTADKIKEMIDNKFPVGSDRHPLKASDIAILSRSVRSGIGEALTEALERRGINAYVETEDYFQKREVRLMLSLISVIDNSMQDIPLTAVMRSPIGGFSDNDLAEIRIAEPRGNFYGAVKAYAEDGSDGAVKYKCSRLIKNLARWKSYKKRKSVAELIWSVYEETGLYDFMGAIDGGEESQANLRLLYERAKKYERTGFKGLFSFIKYIESIQEGKNDLSSASLSEEGHNVVSIMTMHKSKGLEFPVVFLFGTGKKMLARAATKIPMHKDLGFGLMYADGDNGYFEDTICCEIVKNQTAQEELSENLRLLYVAATRAKDKLIVTAAKRVSDSGGGFEEKVENQIAEWQSGIAPADADCYADWIYPTAIKKSDIWDFKSHVYTPTDAEEVTAEDETAPEISDDLRKAVNKSLEFKYEYPQSGSVPTKTSVSALKQLENERDYSERKDEYAPVYMDDVPAFMASGKKGSEIGTAHHQIMAYIDLDAVRETLDTDALYETVISQMHKVADMGEIERYYVETDDMRESIAGHIIGFFRSRIGREALAADEIYRERAFQINIPANRYDMSLDKKYIGENVILQGIIDCYYKKDGRTVLLDYKTDRCASEADVKRIAERYAIQLELYSEAIEKITGGSVDERYLYLFAIGKEVRLK